MTTKTAARRSLLLTAVALGALFGAAVSGAALGAEHGAPRRNAAAVVETEARVIVRFKTDSALMRAQSAALLAAVGPQHAQTLSSRLGRSLSDGRAIDTRTQVLRASGMSSAELAAQLSAQPDVEYAEVDQRKFALAAPVNDPLFLNAAATQTPAAGQWYLQTPDATLVAAINTPAAWAISTGSASVVVADIDTGIRADHPDLASKLVAGRNFVSPNGNGPTGWSADPSDPGDFSTANQCNDGAAASQSSWHGTQTAGLIGAQTNNGAGMASVGYNVMVQPLRVLSTCGGWDSDIQAAMRWAVGLTVPGLTAVNPTPARVINMSLGSTGTCSTSYQTVISEITSPTTMAAQGLKPAVVVVAAGNDGLAVGTPANCSGVVAVVGVRHTGTKVGYSDLGPNATIAAPAGNCVNASGTCVYPILTTSNTGTTTPVAGSAGATYTTGLSEDSSGACPVPGTCTSLGTSFSAPLVSGAAALMISANPALTPAQVIASLKSTARAFPSTGAAATVQACTAPSSTAQSAECYCTTATCGAGLLDAGAAVALVASATANISASATTVTAGTPITFDGSGSRASLGASISTYAWSIVSGTATFSSATNASTATLQTSTPGTVVVGLTVTDSAGKTATAQSTVTVFAAVPPSTGGGGGGGGGAMETGWLLGWLASVIGVWLVTPRRRG